MPPQLKLVFDGFMSDLQNTLDDATQAPLSDDTVITISGDTPKDGDPTGAPVTYNGTMAATYSTASIAYAIAKGDTRAISQFANGISLGGIWVPNQT